MTRSFIVILALALACPLATQQALPEPPVNSLSRFFWVGSGFFFLAFLVALVWAIRPKREDQLRVMGRHKLSRTNAIEELAQLEQDFKKKRIPPVAYTDERAKLLVRAINDSIKGSEQNAEATPEDSSSPPQAVDASQ